MILAQLSDKNWMPEALLRLGVRRLSRKQLQDRQMRARRHSGDSLQTQISTWSQGPLALNNARDESTHAAVPTAFYQRMLGPNMLDVSAYWRHPGASLAEAEQSMFELLAQRARLGDGQHILDLGCGWGAFSLWAAQKYPDARITAVTDTAQRARHVADRKRELGLESLHVIHAELHQFDPAQDFDRVISVGMLQNVRNHALLFERIASWLKEDGRFFAHLCCHQSLSYTFDALDEDSWMSRYIFHSGMMPSFDLFSNYDTHLKIEDRLWLSGEHYQCSAEAWLKNLHRHRKELKQLLGGGPLGQLRLRRWRLFLLAIAEQFGADQGREWGLGQYLFKKTADTT